MVKSALHWVLLQIPILKLIPIQKPQIPKQGHDFT